MVATRIASKRPGAIAPAPRARGGGPEPDTRERFRRARTCYDHLAGELGVALHDRLLARRWLVKRGGDEYEVTRRGEEALAQLGVDVATARAARRRFAYACLDGTARRPHLAGALGAALLASALRRSWITREAASRALSLSRSGRRALLG